jgi:hypothetical protein
MENEIRKMTMDITDYIFTKPEVLWIIVFIGSVAVIGVVDFLKCFIKKQQAVKWIVFFVSLAVAAVLSPLVPPLVATIVILWLLILAVSTMCRNVIVDGLPAIISRAVEKMNNGAAAKEVKDENCKQ